MTEQTMLQYLIYLCTALSDWCLKVRCSNNQYVNNFPLNRYKAVNKRITRWGIINQILFKLKKNRYFTIWKFLCQKVDYRSAVMKLFRCKMYDESNIAVLKTFWCSMLLSKVIPISFVTSYQIGRSIYKKNAKKFHTI